MDPYAFQHSLLKSALSLNDLAAQASPFLFGLLVLAIPPGLYFFKKNEPLLYGVTEIVFSIVLGFIATAKINVGGDAPDLATAWLAFMSALYVGARGWQNIMDRTSATTRP